MTLYYIEEKSFSKLGATFDVMIADAGILPRLFTSLTKAKKAIKRSIEFKVNAFGHTLVSEDENPQSKEATIFYTATLYDAKTDIRIHLSIYQVETL